MEIFNYPNKELFLVGDIHGDFKRLKRIIHGREAFIKTELERQETKKRRKKKSSGDNQVNPFEDPLLNKKQTKRNPRYTNPNGVFVVCGDCGFGFYKPRYYENELTKLNEILKESDSVVLFVRGNHDDPSFFKDSSGGFNFSNIKFVPDYSILKTNNNTTLCIGGAYSHDRTWRKKEEIRLNRFNPSFKRVLYWEDENIQPKDNLALELKEKGIVVDSIITHTLPKRLLSEFYTKLFFDNNEWYSDDKALESDLEKEDEVLASIFHELIDNGHPIQWWTHGHFHTGMINKHDINDQRYVIIFGLNECFDYGYDSSIKNNTQVGTLPSFKIDEYIKSIEHELKQCAKNLKKMEAMTFSTSAPFKVKVSTEEAIKTQANDVWAEILSEHNETENPIPNEPALEDIPWGEEDDMTYYNPLDEEAEEVYEERPFRLREYGHPVFEDGLDEERIEHGEAIQEEGPEINGLVGEIDVRHLANMAMDELRARGEDIDNIDLREEIDNELRGEIARIARNILDEGYVPNIAQAD